ncbi:MAG: filamentous hemagglutinin N-terminal domain-containing protein, partial [Gammaproteobacteria bacterium]
VIDWRGFDIAPNEHTRFQQPSSAAATLNRVHSPSASTINGRLTANGRVYIVNQNGVVFGHNSKVSVGGIVANKAGVTDSDFVAGRDRFGQASENANAAVRNLGRIEIGEGGEAVLAAPIVENAGEISARLGQVALASTNTFTLDLHGDGLLSYDIGSTVRNGSGAVVNSGAITADGGRVTLSARARDALVDTVVNMEGIVRARSVGMRNGMIVLSGGEEGVVAVSGTLDATGTGAGESGGTVKVLGEKIGLAPGARIDASGDAGGGRVLVGGALRGEGPEPNAEFVHATRDTEIRADALNAGDGGEIVVWSNQATRFHGKAFARGGANGGDGGLVETSGRNFLDVDGAVIDASSPSGTPGTWLLDPRNIEIVDDQISCSNRPSTCGPTSGSDLVFTFTPTLDDSRLAAREIVEALNAATSVTVNTGSTGIQEGNIVVNAIIDALVPDQEARVVLTLDAANDIVINRNITSSVIDTRNVAFDLVLDAGGQVVLNADITLGNDTFIGDLFVETNQFSQISGDIVVPSGSVFIDAGNGQAEQGDGRIIARELTVAAGNVDFGSNNSVATLVADVTGAFSFVNSGDLQLGDFTQEDTRDVRSGSTLRVRTVEGDLILQGRVDAAEGVVLDAGGAIRAGTGGGIDALNIGLRSTQAISLNSLIQGAIGRNAGASRVIAADVRGAGQGFSFAHREAVPLVVGTVGDVVGITTNDGTVNLSSTAGALTLNNDIDAGSGDLIIDSRIAMTENGGAGIKGRGLLLTGSGDFDLEGDNDVSVIAALLNRQTPSEGGTPSPIPASLSFNDANGFEIGVTGEVADLRVNDSITLRSNGDVTQTPAGLIEVPALELLGSGNYTLTD